MINEYYLTLSHFSYFSMILSVHFLTGAAVAVKIQNPILGGIFAFLSHYFLDSLPHHEYQINRIKEKKWKESWLDFLKIFLDLSFGILMIFLFSKNLFPAFAGGLLGIAADALTVLFFIFPTNFLLQKHYRFHQKKLHSAIVPQGKMQLFLSSLFQILISFIAIFFLLL